MAEEYSTGSVPKDWVASKIIEKFSYNWIMKDFDQISSKHKGSAQSPIFTTSSDFLCWALHLRMMGKCHDIGSISPSGDTKDQTDVSSRDMVFYLILMENRSSSHPNVFAKFHISVVRDGIEYRKSGCDEYVQFLPGEGKRVVWRKELFDQEGYVEPDGILNIVCNISVKLEDFTQKSLLGERFEMPTSGPIRRVYDRLGKLLDDELFSDVVLSVRGKEFSAHRAILSMHSPVFKAMFEQSKESMHNRVLIADIRPEVIEAMLRFIYTDKVPDNLVNISQGLLGAADKYQLDHLKTVCEEVISRDINISTAAYILVLAHIHSSENLKTKSIQFIAAHPKEVMRTEGWALLTKHPLLLTEICKVLAKADGSRRSKGHKQSHRTERQQRA